MEIPPGVDFLDIRGRFQCRTGLNDHTLEIIAKNRIDGQRLGIRKERNNLIELLGGAVNESDMYLSEMLEELSVIADQVGRSVLCFNQL